MRLADLRPKLTGTLDEGVLRFDCPFPGHTHAIRLFIHRGEHGPKVAPESLCPCGEAHKYWTATGDSLDTLSLFPSINAATAETPCWHGHVTNGAIT